MARINLDHAIEILVEAGHKKVEYMNSEKRTDMQMMVDNESLASITLAIATLKLSPEYKIKK